MEFSYGKKHIFDLSQWDMDVGFSLTASGIVGWDQVGDSKYIEFEPLVFPPSCTLVALCSLPFSDSLFPPCYLGFC